MKNVFSVNEPAVELDPSFEIQAAAQRGGAPVAPPTDMTMPAHSPVPLPTAIERIAEHAAPGSAHKAGNTHV